MWCREDTLFCVWVKFSVNISFVFFIYNVCSSSISSCSFHVGENVLENGVLKCQCERVNL